MARRRSPDDPYRTLGVLPGADAEAIKAAHRRLAKRFHPDGSMGDEGRFLAIQEAYQLLSDPLRRREWDRRHASGPLSARGPATAASTGMRRGSRRTTAPPQAAPGVRHTTWSARHVPWWEDFRPRARGSDGAPDPDAASRPRPGSESPAPAAARPTSGGPDHPEEPVMDLDVFSRSSGAAWSMAARRHFRKGDEELPSRGAWRYRGTQVVTGAEARKVAAEEEAERAAQGARARTPPAAKEPPAR
jgi:curved DNA-binding protein CbpA